MMCDESTLSPPRNQATHRSHNLQPRLFRCPKKKCAMIGSHMPSTHTTL